MRACLETFSRTDTLDDAPGTGTAQEMESAPGSGAREMNTRIAFPFSVHTVPRAFLDTLIADRAAKRLRLLPPYREYLSQPFARFFMRVGLPTPITRVS